MKLKNKLFNNIYYNFISLVFKNYNVLQYDNKLAYPIVLVTMIALFSYITIYIQENIDDNYHQHKIYLSKFKYFKICLIYFSYYFTFKTIYSLF